jgi:ABC transporter substrate binding protein
MSAFGGKADIGNSPRPLLTQSGHRAAVPRSTSSAQSSGAAAPNYAAEAVCGFLPTTFRLCFIGEQWTAAMAVAEKIGTAAHAPTKHAWAPAALACMGVVFGDIGTSPLYTLGVRPKLSSPLIAIWSLHSPPNIGCLQFMLGAFLLHGGLMSYGIDLVDVYQQSASYVDRILRGANPADLPVQSPTRYETDLNLKTAKALGFSVPASLLVRADEVIE